MNIFSKENDRRANIAGTVLIVLIMIYISIHLVMFRQLKPYQSMQDFHKEQGYIDMALLEVSSKTIGTILYSVDSSSMIIIKKPTWEDIRSAFNNQQEVLGK